MKATYKPVTRKTSSTSSSSYPPSEQQQAVLDWAENSIGNLNLLAYAGCGKTSTLKMLVEQLKDSPSNKQGILLCAFNKSIATELEAWLEEKGIAWNRATAGTIHSVGFRAWKKSNPRISVDGKKLWKIVDELYPRQGTEKPTLSPEVAAECTFDTDGYSTADHPARRYGSFVVKLVDLAKQQALGVLGQIDDDHLWSERVEHFYFEDSYNEFGVFLSYADEVPPNKTEVSLTRFKELCEEWKQLNK